MPKIGELPFELSESITEWVKYGKVKDIFFVGRDTVCLMAGVHMTFLDLNSKRETILRANDPAFNSEGMACAAGHRFQNIFAFADRAKKPKALVIKYPDLKVINWLTGSAHDYLTMTFVEGDMLIALSSYPTCGLDIWKWRTGEFVKNIDTKLLYSQQILATNFTTPVYLTQCCPNTRNLILWDISLCGKKCLVADNKILYRKQTVTGNFSSCLFAPDGTFYMLDVKGNVFCMAADQKLDLIITWETEGMNVPKMCWYQGGLLVQGPCSQIKHFRKDQDWASELQMKVDTHFKILISSMARDFLIGVTLQNDTVRWDANSKKFVLLKSDEGDINNFCVINPFGEHIATLSHHNKIILWDLEDGSQVDVFNSPRSICSIRSNPQHPYIAVGHDVGVLKLFWAISGKFEPLSELQLCRRPISRIDFAEKGKFVVACDMDIGQFFIVDGDPHTRFVVLSSVLANSQIADYTCVGSPYCLRLFMIYVTSDKYIAGNCIHRFCIVKDAEPTLKRYEIENPDRLYAKLYESKEEGKRDRQIYAIPLDSKNLHVLEMKRGDTHARIVHRFKSFHLMRRIRYHLTDIQTLSYSYGGLVLIRPPRLESEVITDVVMPHHWMDGGIVQAYADPYGRKILSLGRDGTLVCTTLVNKVVDEIRASQIKENVEVCPMTVMKRTTFGWNAKQGKVSWLEYLASVQAEKEREKYEYERKAIVDGINRIREKTTALLTRNQSGPENEFLDLQEFNLNLALKEEKIKASKELCERTKVYLKGLIAEHDRIADAIKAKFWDVMSVPTRNLKAIFGNLEARSYGMLSPDGATQERLNWVREWRKVEQALGRRDKFAPWECLTEEEIAHKMVSEPKISTSDDPKAKLLQVVDDDDEESAEGAEAAVIKRRQYELERASALQGVTLQYFVEPLEGHYDQRETHTYFQHYLQCIFSEEEQNKLRAYFNKEFEAIAQLKVREMNSIIEKNARLRYIISEINYFSKEQLDITIADPEWSQDEHPEKLLRVEDDEVKVIPYVSPSEQAILDAKAAEAERQRLLRQTDDFKERALMKMMNGVLEVRWEDELRKDVPKPKCILEKSPENYNEDDLRQIRDYDEKVAFLNSERERYKTMLEQEYGRTAAQIRESVRRFNERLQDLVVCKTKVETAIQMEVMRMHRNRIGDIEKNKLNKNEAKIIDAIAEKDQNIHYLHSLSGVLNEVLEELKVNLETLQAKDKSIDKAFRKEFQDTSSGQLETLQKLYKKRPRINLKSLTSFSILLDTAKCVATNTQVDINNKDAEEYLKALELMDKYVGVPAVDPVQFSAVCRHRRIKIENELKVRAAQLELSESENTQHIFQKTAIIAKEEAQHLEDSLKSVRAQKIRNFTDTDLQIVLRGGLIEIARTGSLSDFENAVLIPRKIVEDANKVVMDTGSKKLKAMRSAMAFKREIVMQEWLYKQKKMKIADLQQYLVDIDSVKVTKEIQTYLKSRTRGDNAERFVSLDQEVAGIKARYQRDIDEKKKQVSELQTQIQTAQTKNAELNQELEIMNVDVTELKLNIDESMDEKEKRINRMRISAYMKRSKLITQVQANHQEILVLQAELELLRLRTVPVLDYKIDD